MRNTLFPVPVLQPVLVKKQCSLFQLVGKLFGSKSTQGPILLGAGDARVNEDDYYAPKGPFSE